MVQKGRQTDLTIEWVGLGRCWEGDSESEGSPERGMSGCFRVWEGFVEGALQLGFKEDTERESEGEAHPRQVQIFVSEDCGQ